MCECIFLQQCKGGVNSIQYSSQHQIQRPSLPGARSHLSDADSASHADNLVTRVMLRRVLSRVGFKRPLERRERIFDLRFSKLARHTEVWIGSLWPLLLCAAPRRCAIVSRSALPPGPSGTGNRRTLPRSCSTLPDSNRLITNPPDQPNSDHNQQGKGKHLSHRDPLQRYYHHPSCFVTKISLNNSVFFFCKSFFWRLKLT